MLLIFRKQLHLLQLMQLTTFIHILYAVKEPKCKMDIYKYQETLLKRFRCNTVDNKTQNKKQINCYCEKHNNHNFFVFCTKAT